MTLIAKISKLARLGDVAAINALLDQSPEYGEQIIRGRAAADKLLGRDKPLPQLSRDPLLHPEDLQFGRLRPRQAGRRLRKAA